MKILLLKTFDLKNYLKSDFKTNGVLLTQRMNTTPVIMGVTQNTMTIVGSEMYDKNLLAKSDMTVSDILNRFGDRNAIT
eukprot:4536313-Heterocapsa_arctica.AAC.1